MAQPQQHHMQSNGVIITPLHDELPASVPSGYPSADRSNGGANPAGLHAPIFTFSRLCPAIAVQVKHLQYQRRHLCGGQGGPPSVLPAQLPADAVQRARGATAHGSAGHSGGTAELCSAAVLPARAGWAHLPGRHSWAPPHCHPLRRLRLPGPLAHHVRPLPLSPPATMLHG
jgi:hypothetical protein